MIEFKNFDVDFNCDIKATEEGFLHPIVYGANLKFGDSYYYHDNEFIAFFMEQVVEFGIVIMENSVYFVGEYIFTNMAGPVLTTFLNNF